MNEKKKNYNSIGIVIVIFQGFIEKIHVFFDLKSRRAIGSKTFVRSLRKKEMKFTLIPMENNRSVLFKWRELGIGGRRNDVDAGNLIFAPLGEAKQPLNATLMGIFLKIRELLSVE